MSKSFLAAFHVVFITVSRAGMCKRALPRKCCKVFCALAVTVKRSVDQLFMHYFHNFRRVEVVLVVLACVLRALTKIRSSTFLRKKVHPLEKIL